MNAALYDNTQESFENQPNALVLGRILGAFMHELGHSLANNHYNALAGIDLTGGTAQWNSQEGNYLLETSDSLGIMTNYFDKTYEFMATESLSGTPFVKANEGKWGIGYVFVDIIDYRARIISLTNDIIQDSAQYLAESPWICTDTPDAEEYVIDGELYVNYEPLNTDIDHLNRRFGLAAVYNNPLWSGLQGGALYGGALKFKHMEIGKAGIYTVKVYYSCTYLKYAYLKVNEKLPEVLKFVSTGSYDNIGVVRRDVYLEGGTNYLTLTNYANNSFDAPHTDKVSVALQTPDPDPVVVIQAKDDSATNTTGSPVVLYNGKFFGGKYLCGFAGSLEFPSVTVPASGNYTLKIYYNSAVKGYANPSINNSTNSVLTFPDTILTQNASVRVVKADIQLNAGTNSITLSNGANGAYYTPEFDKIEILAGSSNPLIDCIEAEDPGSILTGQAVVVDLYHASGMKKVSHLGGTIQFPPIYVNEAGEYRLKIYYTTPEYRYTRLNINGVTNYFVRFPPPANWNKIGVLEMTVTLSQGNNTLLFSNNAIPFFPNMYWTVDFDKIELYRNEIFGKVNTKGGTSPPLVIKWLTIPTMKWFCSS